MLELTCRVCKKSFYVSKYNKYTVSQVVVEKEVFPPIAIKKHYEAFDCPYCGCQNIVNERIGGDEDE